jgi:tetraacyldisaccharide 4'-kinase
VAIALPASWLYGVGARVFHGLHDHGLLRHRRVSQPVVSVGALSAGGSGKTPFTRWLTARLRERGHRPAILSRGYHAQGGSEPRLVNADRPDAVRDGDEPALLARTCPDVPVIVAPDRARGAALAAGRGASVLVLDDGFQHRRLVRDVDIVLVSGDLGGRGGWVLPAGPLREPIAGLRRAEVVVLVDRGGGLPAEPTGLDASARVFQARLVPTANSRIDEGASVHALSGVADPASFEHGLESLGLVLTGATRYPDHHPFTRLQVFEAADRASEEGADHLAVTAKDRARWPSQLVDRPPVPAVFDLDVEVDSEDLLLELVESRLAGGAPR